MRLAADEPGSLIAAGEAHGQAGAGCDCACRRHPSSCDGWVAECGRFGLKWLFSAMPGQTR